MIIPVQVSVYEFWVMFDDEDNLMNIHRIGNLPVSEEFHDLVWSGIKLWQKSTFREQMPLEPFLQKMLEISYET